MLIDPCFNPQAEYNIQIEPITGLEHSLQTYVFIGRANKGTTIDEIETLFDNKAYASTYDDYKELTSTLSNKVLPELSYHARTHRSWNGLDGVNFHKDKDAWDKDRIKRRQQIRQILQGKNPLKNQFDAAKRDEIYDYVAWQLLYEVEAKWNPLDVCLQTHFSYWLGCKLDDSVINSLSKTLLEQTPQYFEHESYDKNEQSSGGYNPYRYAIGPIKHTKIQNVDCKLSSQQVIALKQLNDRLAVLEKEVLEDAINLELKIKKHVADTGKIINHYYLILDISVYMEKETDEQNSWLFFTKELGSGCSENQEEFLQRLSIDHNSLPSNHPLSSFKHCWLFHQLYAVQNASFNDLLKINSTHGKVEAAFYTPFLDFTAP